MATSQQLMDLLQAGDSGYAHGYLTGFSNGGQAAKRFAYILASTSFVIGAVAGIIAQRLL